MAVANLKKIDDKLKNIYENQVTVNNNQPFEDCLLYTSRCV